MKRLTCLFVAIAVLLIVNTARAEQFYAGSPWHQYQSKIENELVQDYYDWLGKRRHYLRAGETTALLHPDVHFFFEKGTTNKGEKVFIGYAPGYSDKWNIGYITILESELNAAARNRFKPKIIFENLAVPNVGNLFPGNYLGGKPVDAKIRVRINDILSVGTNFESYQLNSGLNLTNRAGFGVTFDLRKGVKLDAEIYPLNFSDTIPRNQPMIKFGVRIDL
ncbi:MAG: hypothetical protein V1928_04305 [Parcubacteria group bacterium]